MGIKIFCCLIRVLLHPINEINIDFHREEINIYVNPAWNKNFDIVKTKYITLLNNY